MIYKFKSTLPSGKYIVQLIEASTEEEAWISYHLQGEFEIEGDIYSPRSFIEVQLLKEEDGKKE